MMIKKAIASALLALWSSLVCSAEFSAEQKKEIESIVADYVSTHPDVIIAAMQKLEKDENAKLAENIVKIAGELRQDQSVPHHGDAKAKHYLIEFFDFYCGYCKLMEPKIEQLRKDLNLQVIYVNIPVIRPNSKELAVIGQAVYNLNPDAYFKFHGIYMNPDVSPDSTIEGMKKELSKMGVKWDDVLAQAKSNVPQNQISRYMKFATELKISGTPYFIIDGKEYRGAIGSYEELKALFKD